MMISIVIPAYNEGEGIKDVLNGIRDTLKEDLDYEILVVDDGSTDETAEIVKNEGVRLIQHSYNRGYGAALKTGTKHARGDFVLYMDADSQHNPKDIIELLKHMNKNDMVVGARTKESSIPFTRRIGKTILTFIANYLSETKIPDLNSGLRLVRKNVVIEFIHLLPNTFSFTTTITLACIKSGYNIKYVPINTTERVGDSKINPFRDGFRFIMLILRTVVLFDPLKVFLPVSIVLFIFGFLELVREVVFSLSIWSTSMLLLLSSILIFFFGLLADQISILRWELK